MELVRGNGYQIKTKDAVCLNCSSDMNEVIDGSVLVYLGKLDGRDFFIYDNPPACPQCYHSLRYHVEKFIIEVTDEFQKMLDKK